MSEAFMIMAKDEKIDMYETELDCGALKDLYCYVYYEVVREDAGYYKGTYEFKDFTAFIEIGDERIDVTTHLTESTVDELRASILEQLES